MSSTDTVPRAGAKTGDHIGNVRPASTRPSFTPWQYQSSCSRMFSAGGELRFPNRGTARRAAGTCPSPPVRLIRDPLGGLAASYRPGEVHLGRAIDGVHISQHTSVEPRRARCAVCRSHPRRRKLMPRRLTTIGSIRAVYRAAGNYGIATAGHQWRSTATQ